MYLVGFPLLLIPFAIYNIVAFLMPGVGWGDPLTRLSFSSGGVWTMSLGDMLVALAILLLLIEIIKAYRLGGRNLVDHGLSILLLLAACAEFYLVARAATATFFLLIVASLADVVGGLVAMRKHKPRYIDEPSYEDRPVNPPVADPPPPPDIEPVKPATVVEPSVAITPAPDVPPPAQTVVMPESEPVKPAAEKPVSDKS